MLTLVVFRSKFPGRKFKSHPGVPPARLLEHRTDPSLIHCTDIDVTEGVQNLIWCS